MSPSIKQANFLILFLSIALAMCFLLHVYVLYSGHLHEDAYILFEYVNHIVKGDGIVYYQGGERAEGATDFLWLICLSGLGYLGIDVGIASALLNTLGFTVISYTLIKQVTTEALLQRIALAAVVLLVLLLSPMTAASLGGFGTLFYVACSLILVDIFWQQQHQRFLWIPLVSIVLGLIRPDGVILGVAFSLLGLYELRRSPLLVKYCLLLLAVTSIGMTYFAWRYHYFGHLLPLPLYVKVVNAGDASGWHSNWRWLSQTYNQVLLIFVAIGVYFLFDRQQRLKCLKVALPFLILLCALGFSQQSQNIAYRFQGPVLGLLFFLFVLSLCQWFKNKPTKRHYVLIVLLLIVLVQSLERRFAKEIAFLQDDNYINYFPQLLSQEVNGETVMGLTEAGRMAFWNDARTFDLVGLNTAEVGVNGLDGAYLQRINADLLFIHTAGIVELEVDPQFNFIEVDIHALMKKLKPHYQTQLSADPVVKAPQLVMRFLAENSDEWTVYLVRYVDKFHHLYAVRNNGRISQQAFITQLEKSFDKNYQLSYWALRFQ